jgi:PAS domain S-box-containing protein
MMAGEIDSYALEKRFVRKDRAIIWTSLAAGCARKPNGAVDFVCASIQDITERRPAEAARRESPELPT